MKVLQAVRLRVEGGDALLVTETDHGTHRTISLHGSAHRYDGAPDWGDWSIDVPGKEIRQAHIQALAWFLGKLQEELARQEAQKPKETSRG